MGRSTSGAACGFKTLDQGHEDYTWKLSEKLRFDAVADYYDQEHVYPIHWVLMRRFVIKVCSAYFNKKSVGLEIGAGSGPYTPELCFLSQLVVATDISRRMLKRLKLRTQSFTNIELVICDADHLPFRDSSFDWIFFESILHHLPEPGLTVSRASRVVDGYVFAFEASCGPNAVSAYKAIAKFLLPRSFLFLALSLINRVFYPKFIKRRMQSDICETAKKALDEFDCASGTEKVLSETEWKDVFKNAHLKILQTYPVFCFYPKLFVAAFSPLLNFLPVGVLTYFRPVQWLLRLTYRVGDGIIVIARASPFTS